MYDSFNEYLNYTLSTEEMDKVSKEETLIEFKKCLERELLLRNITLTLREVIELAKGNKLNVIKLQKFRLGMCLKEVKEQYEEIIDILSEQEIIIATKEDVKKISMFLFSFDDLMIEKKYMKHSPNMENNTNQKGEK